MSDGLGALTEKEKVALRLLLSGHDAKTSAAALEISVHTVNDRLRNARRKLGVSSSREAARILGVAESATPQNDVHKPLAVEQFDNRKDDVPAVDESGREMARPAWRSKGAFIMTFTIAASALIIAIVGFGGAEETEPAEPAAVTASVQAASEAEARDWLALTDVGNFEDSRAQASQSLRDQYSEAIWELGITLRRTSGVAESRELISVTRSDRMLDGRNGEFEILSFDTDFTGRGDATEIVTMERVGGEWLVADYDIAYPDSC